MGRKAKKEKDGKLKRKETRKEEERKRMHLDYSIEREKRVGGHVKKVRERVGVPETDRTRR